MSIRNLMITSVEGEYNQEYIAKVFWKLRIAKVSSVTLIPYLKNGETYSIAYINVDQWCDSEVSYNFIKRLINPSKENRVIHCDENWWVVKINSHNNGDIQVGSYTVTFDAAYFERREIAVFADNDDYQANLFKLNYIAIEKLLELAELAYNIIA